MYFKFSKFIVIFYQSSQSPCSTNLATSFEIYSHLAGKNFSAECENIRLAVRWASWARLPRERDKWPTSDMIEVYRWYVRLLFIYYFIAIDYDYTRIIKLKLTVTPTYIYIYTYKKCPLKYCICTANKYDPKDLDQFKK